ncbi:MAG: hypothetical protein ABJN36_18235 [Cyclobacteriaceae bacterium]
MKVEFELVDAGCFMFENDHGRWIIQHPKNGYLETASKMWDTLVEHPESPHDTPVKFLGSFNTKTEAKKHLEHLIRDHNFESVSSVENAFYSHDYYVK